MKLQSASRKEIKRVAIGTLVCDLILIAGLFLLSQFGIGKFEVLPILLAALGGTLIAVLNFTILCLTVQSAVGMEDQKKMKAKFQLSYNARMILQAGWVIICFLVKELHLFAGALPLFFPKVTILYLQARGKLLPPDSPNAQPDIQENSSESSES